MGKEIIELQVDGMDCNNCAASIARYLERKGLEDVFVNFQTKEVRFRRDDERLTIDKAKAGINKLGYTVVEESTPAAWWTLERKLLISAIFTAPLLFGHFFMMAGLHLPWLENGYVQLLLCLPPFIIGSWHFGHSALSSMRGGVPNMDVLIFIGSTAAFVYSVTGLVLQNPDYYFFETAATIITLVLIGNWLEHRAVEQTTTAIGELTQLQAEFARQVMPSGTIVKINKDDIRPGMTLQVNEGDKIPADGRVLSGEGSVDESMLTGESLPQDKSEGEEVIGASLLLSGNVRIQVTAAGRDTVLNQMIELVKTAQQDKPPIQRLADRISAIFVPVVLSISLLTFLIGRFGFDLSFQQALMNAIAVLVISCPCAMGLATPTAVMVGVGRLARNGVLIKGGQTVEALARIRNMVFDKTGTLTTGDFRIDGITYPTDEPELANALLYRLEQHSSHPIAHSLLRALQDAPRSQELPDLRINEEKGLGLQAEDGAGNTYRLGSRRILSNAQAAEAAGEVFLTRNDELLAAVRLGDDLKAAAPEAIAYLKAHEIEPVVLSGDRQAKTAQIAEQLGINQFYGEQLPQEKLDRIDEIRRTGATAMVGDGINDAPALARADLGISLSNASQVAIQSAQVVLLNGHLDTLPKALSISRHTVKTIRQNLFWAFAYNVVAIPIAAVGLLNPMWGALFMAFSDVVVIGNSIRLKYKRIG